MPALTLLAALLPVACGSSSGGYQPVEPDASSEGTSPNTPPAAKMVDAAPSSPDAAAVDAALPMKPEPDAAPARPVDGGAASADQGIAVADSMTCAELAQQAGDRIRASVRMAEADESCASDDDCVVTSAASDCGSYSCGTLLNQKGLVSVQVTLDELNAGVCARFVQQGCRFIPPPCVPPPSAACVNGVCSDFPPAKWLSFSVEKDASAGFGIPPSCNPGAACTVWTVTPDREIVKIDSGRRSSSFLSPGDFATVDAILRSMAFREHEKLGFSCGPRPATGGVAFAVARANGTVGFDVTGCVSVGGDSDPSRLMNVVARY
jgi:hypothetical protein